MKKNDDHLQSLTGYRNILKRSATSARERDRKEKDSSKQMCSYFSVLFISFDVSTPSKQNASDLLGKPVANIWAYHIMNNKNVSHHKLTNNTMKTVKRLDPLIIDGETMMQHRLYFIGLHV